MCSGDTECDRRVKSGNELISNSNEVQLCSTWEGRGWQVIGQGHELHPRKAKSWLSIASREQGHQALMEKSSKKKKIAKDFKPEHKRKKINNCPSIIKLYWYDLMECCALAAVSCVSLCHSRAMTAATVGYEGPDPSLCHGRRRQDIQTVG